MKQISIYLVAALTATLTLAGCQKEVPQAQETTLGLASMTFELAAAVDELDTRALKSAWADGDRIVVLFDGTTTNYVTLTYNASDETWTRSAAAGEISATEGTARALHAGSGALACDGTSITGIGGDLLFTDEGTYVVEGGTARLTLTLSRGVTTVVKMEGAGDNASALLAGEGISVLKASPTLTMSALAEGFGAAIPTLFEPSDMGAGKAAHADPHYTTATVAVFHVYAPVPPTDTKFMVGKQGEEMVYTREYDGQSLVAGGSVVIVGPWSEEEDQIEAWTETTIEPSANEITLWANDTGVPFDFTAAGNWTVTVTEGLTSSGSEAYWIELLAPEGYPAYGGPAGVVNLYAEVEPNLTGEERTATITIYDGTKQTVYHIIQSGRTKNGGFIRPYEPDPAGHDVVLMSPDGHGWLFAGTEQLPGMPDDMGPNPNEISYRRGLNGVKAGRFVFLRAVPHVGYEPPTWRVETAEGQQEINVQEMAFGSGVRVPFFEMPDEAVTAQAMFLPTTYTITVTAVGRGTAWASPSSDVEAGSFVELRATANSDYEFVEWRSTDGNPIPFSTGGTNDEYSFIIMPTRNVSVEGVFAPAPGTQDYNNITVTMTREGGLSAFANLDADATAGATTLTAKEDDVVYFTAAAQDGYAFAGWYGNVDFRNFISPDGASYNPTAIVMPRRDVNMKATFVPTGAVLFLKKWWVPSGVDGNHYVEITGNRFVYHQGLYRSDFILEDIVWEPITTGCNEEYPTAYKILGTVTKRFHWPTWNTVDKETGENYVIVYLSVDGKSLTTWDDFTYPDEIVPNWAVVH
jgi:outer membrane murein-binding lipoprotein Lpp